MTGTKTRSGLSLREMTFTAMFTVLIAVGAFIKIPVPVVPFTMQYFFTMMAGLILGGRFGALSAGLYVFLGLAGLPIFAKGGGIGYVLEPTFGYLIGFIVGTWLTGTLAGRVSRPSMMRIAGANLAGLVTVYAFGTIYCILISDLYLGQGTGILTMLLYCVILPIPGDLLLCFAGAWLAQRMLPILRQQVR